jgi:hypothetical protein
MEREWCIEEIETERGAVVVTGEKGREGERKYILVHTNSQSWETRGKWR